MPGLDIGVVLPSMSMPRELPGDVVAAARHAEDLGFESVWAVDQLIAGTGTPLIDSTVVLAAAAGATTRVRLGFGAMILPLHPVVWVAKQIASLQHVSDGRIIFGVGAGGDRHELSWAAAGVPRRERGRRTDAALRVLPGLIAGEAVKLEAGGPAIRLAPPATVPPILVGGMSDAAITRAAEYGDGWFAMATAGLTGPAARLAELAAARGRPVPEVTAAMTVAMLGDPALPDEDALVRRLTDVDGMFGIPAEFARQAVVIGSPEDIAERLAEAAANGAARVVVTFAGGDWHRQAELLAEAAGRLSTD
ncbi:MAG: LLM class flavin-dependent oxidoreductase [Streptosporangiaceae bacterium]|nr:LLM class flavin-dependent oxidoreductase [Streptosporangiaceae bacterium]